VPNQLALIIVYLLLVFGYTSTHGFYSFPAFLLILISYILLLFSTQKFSQRKIFTNSIYLIFFASLSMSLVYYGGLYQLNNSLKLISYLIIFFLIPISFLYIFNISSLINISRNKFIVFLVCAVLLRIFMIVSSPEPKIDVYNSLKFGSASIISGKNPYEITFPKIYPNQIPTLYGYFPGSAIILLPFTLILNDPRYAYILADLGSALILFWLLKTNINKNYPSIHELIPLIFLYNPMSLFVIEQSWLEPLLTFFVFLFVFLYLKNKLSYWPFIILGVALSIKQSMILIIPSLFLKLQWNIKQLLTVGLVSTLIIVPFFLWNPKEFIFDLTAGFNPVYNTAPANASLSLSSFLYNIKGLNLNNFIRFLSILLLSILIFKKSQNSILDFIYSYTLFVFTVTMFYAQAFLNYFTFLSSLILMILAVSFPNQKSK